MTKEARYLIMILIMEIITNHFNLLNKKQQNKNTNIYFQCRAATGAVVAALIKESQLEMEFAKMRGAY